MIILDTSVLYAYAVRSDPRNLQATDFIDTREGEFVLSPYVVAEIDYLIAKRFGVKDELAVLRGIASGIFELPLMTAPDLIDCSSLIEHYSAHKIGVADASLVVLAHRYQTRKIATFDRRHFSILKTFEGDSFELLP